MTALVHGDSLLKEETTSQQRHLCEVRGRESSRVVEQLGSINLVNTSVSQQHEVKKRKKEATNAGFQ